MEAVLKTWKHKELQHECMKNGMAISGTKPMLIKRIVENIPGKRKPGQKPKAAIAKKKVTSKVTSAIKSYPIELDKKQMDALGLFKVGKDQDANGNTVYKYAKLNPCAFKAPVAEIVCDDDCDDGDSDYCDSASQSGSERSDDLMDDTTFNKWKEKLASRLDTQRMPRTLLVKLIKVYDPKQKLLGVDKTDLVEALVEQLMYETDDEEDE